MGKLELRMWHVLKVDMGSRPIEPQSHYQAKSQEWNMEALLRFPDQIYRKIEYWSRQYDIEKYFRFHISCPLLSFSSGTLEQDTHSQQGHSPSCILGISSTCHKDCLQANTEMGDQTCLQKNSNRHSHGKIVLCPTPEFLRGFVHMNEDTEHIFQFTKGDKTWNKLKETLQKWGERKRSAP